MIKMKYVKQMGEILNFISYKISLIAIFTTILACVDIDNEENNTQQLGQDQNDFENIIKLPQINLPNSNDSKELFHNLSLNGWQHISHPGTLSNTNEYLRWRSKNNNIKQNKIEYTQAELKYNTHKTRTMHTKNTQSTQNTHTKQSHTYTQKHTHKS